MPISPLSLLAQLEALQFEALESCSSDTKKLLLEIAIEKTQSLKEALDKPLYAPYDGGMTIAFRIQLARENIGLTEADLARQLNTHSDYVLFWERGDTEIPANMIIPLSNALKCDPLWLLTGEITPQASSDNVAQQHHRASQQAGGVSREVLQQ